MTCKFTVSFSEGFWMAPIVRVLDNEVVQIRSLFPVLINSILLPVAANIYSRNTQFFYTPLWVYFFISGGEWAVSVHHCGTLCSIPNCRLTASFAPVLKNKKKKTSGTDCNSVHSPFLLVSKKSMKCNKTSINWASVDTQFMLVLLL